MPLSDPLNGVYRAGFAYQQKSYSVSNTAIQLNNATFSTTLTLTIPQMLEAATLAFTCQITEDTANKTFTVTVAKNGAAIATYSGATAIVSTSPPNSFVIADTSIPLFGTAFAGEVYTITIAETQPAGAFYTNYAATLSIAGVPN